MKIFLIGIIIGALLFYVIAGMFDKELPDMFEIEKNGKVVGYADTDFSKSEFVNLSGKGIKSPGEFIAFPIYESKEL